MSARKSKKRQVSKRTGTTVVAVPAEAPKQSRRSRGGAKRYSDAERQNILATAKREGLTAAKVKERFGVTPVTYYSWRKKNSTGKGKSSGRAAAAGEVVGKTVAGAMNVADAIREEIRAHIRKILPGLLADEFGEENGRRKRGLRK